MKTRLKRYFKGKIGKVICLLRGPGKKIAANGGALRNLCKSALLFCAVLMATNMVWADVPTSELHKVLLLMKDGTKIPGYVSWGGYYDEGEFDPQGFFGRPSLKDANENVKFSFFKNIYAIHDNGLLGGLACAKEDYVRIDVKQVAKILSIPDRYEGKTYDCFTILSKEQIGLMQNRLICSEQKVLDTVEINAFSFDPAVGPKELHRLLWDYCAANDSVSGREKWEKEPKPERVFFVATGCD